MMKFAYYVARKIIRVVPTNCLIVHVDKGDSSVKANPPKPRKQETWQQRITRIRQESYARKPMEPTTKFYKPARDPMLDVS